MGFREILLRRIRGEPAGSRQWEEHALLASPPPKPHVGLSILLFFITLGTTIVAGALQEVVNPLKNPG